MGIRTVNTYSYLVEEAGGFENVGFIKWDCYNVVNKQKLINVEARDAQSLVNHFKQKQAEDSMFFLCNSSWSRKSNDKFLLERW